MEEEEPEKLNVVLHIKEVRGLGFLGSTPFIVYCSLQGSNLESAPCRADMTLSSADLLFMWTKAMSSLDRLRTCNVKVEMQYSEVARTRIGFINVSLRESQILIEQSTKKFSYSWRSLLGGRRGKPQLLMNLRLERFKGSSVAGDFQPVSLADSIPEKQTFRLHSPVALNWDTDEGLFTMSPRAEDQQLFRFSICIKSALNLDLVLLHGLPMKGPDFQFSYEFLGLVVPVASFRNIMDCSEGEDRWGLYFRGSFEVFQQYFEIFPTIILSLMIGEDRIGYVKINVNDILKNASWNSDDFIKVEKRSYILSSRSGAIPSGADGSKPSIVVVISLKIVPQEEWINRNKNVKANLKENIILSPNREKTPTPLTIVGSELDVTVEQIEKNNCIKLCENTSQTSYETVKESVSEDLSVYLKRSKTIELNSQVEDQKSVKCDDVFGRAGVVQTYEQQENCYMTPENYLKISPKMSISGSKSNNSGSISKSNSGSFNICNRIPEKKELQMEDIDAISSFHLRLSVCAVVLYDEGFCGPLFCRIVHPLAEDSCVTRMVILEAHVEHKCENIQCSITYDYLKSRAESFISNWPPRIFISKSVAVCDSNPVVGIVNISKDSTGRVSHVTLKTVANGHAAGKATILFQHEQLNFMCGRSDSNYVGCVISPDSIKMNKKRAVIKRKQELLSKKKLKKALERKRKETLIEIQNHYSEKFAECGLIDAKILEETLELHQDMTELQDIYSDLNKLLKDIECERKKETYKQCTIITRQLREMYKVYKRQHRECSKEIDLVWDLELRNLELRSSLFPTQKEVNNAGQNLEIGKRIHILENEIQTCHVELNAAKQERCRLIAKYATLVNDIEDFIREKKLYNAKNGTFNRYIYHSTSNYVKTSMISRGIYPGSKEYRKVSEVVQEMTSWESYANAVYQAAANKH